MSYRARVGAALAQHLRVEPNEAHIVCDSCGVTQSVYSSEQSCALAKWVLDLEPAPGWELVRQEGVRGWDYCPACKERRKGRQAMSDEQRSAEDWAGMWSIANDRANAAEARIAVMREAIHHWRCVGHERWCHVRADCPCNCGADETNAARERARKAAGLEAAS